MSNSKDLIKFGCYDCVQEIVSYWADDSQADQTAQL